MAILSLCACKGVYLGVRFFAFDLGTFDGFRFFLGLTAVVAVIVCLLAMNSRVFWTLVTCVACETVLNLMHVIVYALLIDSMQEGLGVSLDDLHMRLLSVFCVECGFDLVFWCMVFLLWRSLRHGPARNNATA